MQGNTGSNSAQGNANFRQPYIPYHKRPPGNASGGELGSFREFDEGAHEINEPPRPEMMRGGDGAGAASFADRAKAH